MIELKNISLNYKNKEILREFNLKVNAGEKVTLTGPSGSGKTTILKLLLGFLEPTSGSIIINGETLEESSILNWRSKVAYIPQEMGLDMKVIEVFELAQSFKINKTKLLDRETLEKLLHDVNLNIDLLEQSYKKLSGGQKQRVLIVNALMQDKPILLADEITSALDQESKKRVLRLLKTRKKITMLAVSHDKDFIQAFERQIKIP